MCFKLLNDGIALACLLVQDDDLVFMTACAV